MPINDTVSQGKRSRISLLTFSRGRTYQGLIRALELTPKIDGKEVHELTNQRTGALSNVHQGGSGKVDVTYKNEAKLAALIQDRDPSAAGGYVDQKRYRP